jgi:phosphate transport system protein
MAWEVFRKSTGPSLDSMIGHVAQMLGDARHVFDVATSGLVAGADAKVLADDVHETDRRINAAEQEIRRELVVHAGVHGVADITGVMVVLMVSRKVERIGDNAKNIHDLAIEGVSFVGAADIEVLRQHCAQTSSMMAQAAELFRAEDEGAANVFLERTREAQREYDDLVTALVTTDQSGAYAVPRALLYRYLKRIVANLEGVVSSVTQTLDMIDYAPDGSEASET